MSADAARTSACATSPPPNVCEKCRLTIVANEEARAVDLGSLAVVASYGLAQILEGFVSGLGTIGVGEVAAAHGVHEDGRFGAPEIAQIDVAVILPVGRGLDLQYRIGEARAGSAAAFDVQSRAPSPDYDCVAVRCVAPDGGGQGRRGGKGPGVPGFVDVLAQGGWRQAGERDETGDGEAFQADRGARRTGLE